MNWHKNENNCGLNSRIQKNIDGYSLFGVSKLFFVQDKVYLL